MVFKCLSNLANILSIIPVSGDALYSLILPYCKRTRPSDTSTTDCIINCSIHFDKKYSFQPHKPLITPVFGCQLRSSWRHTTNFDSYVCQEIAPRIANDWRSVARNLGFGEHEISNIDANYYGAGRGGIEETALQMLIRWQRRNGQQATKRILINALRNAGFQAVAQTLEGNIN